MTGLQIACAVLMILISIAVIIIVLVQKDRESNLSGTISGGDSSGFFDKTKGKQKEAALEKGTKVLAALFFIVAIATTAIVLFVK